MNTPVAKAVILLILAALYWQAVSWMTGAWEPWDADAYWWLCYPLALLLSALAGGFFGRSGWLAGAIVIFAQLPILWVNSGAGSMLPVGLFFLSILAVPAMALSALTAWLAMHGRSA